MNPRYQEPMNIARGIGESGRVPVYEVPDNELAVGSTLGAPKVAAIIKANGAIEKVFSIDLGEVLFGTLILRHYDGVTGMHLAQDRPGTFSLHPEHQEHQEHRYWLSDQVSVHESIFVLNTGPGENVSVDPPGVYQIVEMQNDGSEPVEIVTYAYAVLRGETSADVVATYDHRLGALVVWNKSKPDQCRIFGCSMQPESYETTLDYANAISERCPGSLSGKTEAPLDPLGVLQHGIHLQPGASVKLSYLLSCGNGRREAAANYRACPDADEALARTKTHFRTSGPRRASEPRRETPPTTRQGAAGACSAASGSAYPSGTPLPPPSTPRNSWHAP